MREQSGSWSGKVFVDREMSASAAVVAAATLGVDLLPLGPVRREKTASHGPTGLGVPQSLGVRVSSGALVSAVR